MKKYVMSILLFSILTSPCFGASPVEYPPANQGGYVLLRDHIEALLQDQREYFKSQLHDMDKFNSARFVASEQALSLAKEEYERRFVLLTRYAPEATTFRSQLAELQRDVAVIKKQVDVSSGNQALWVAWGVTFLFILVNMTLQYISRAARNGKPKGD